MSPCLSLSLLGPSTHITVSLRVPTPSGLLRNLSRTPNPHPFLPKDLRHCLFDPKLINTSVVVLTSKVVFFSRKIRLPFCSLFPVSVRGTPVY